MSEEQRLLLQGLREETARAVGYLGVLLGDLAAVDTLTPARLTRLEGEMQCVEMSMTMTRAMIRTAERTLVGSPSD